MSYADGRIPQEILDEISSRLDIVDVIGRYVPLKRSGANYMGLCPFHNENTPSFSVSPSKQIFHCFGCGAGGNIFRFVMDYEHLTFPEAARKLAKEAGVTLPEKKRSQAEQKQFEMRRRLFRAQKMAEIYYQKQLQLPENKGYRDYLSARGISQETIEAFGIGCCHQGWDGLTRYLQANGVQIDEMISLGLSAQNRQKTSYYDRFRDRLMFPIHNDSGMSIGFGGRILKKDEQNQKYLNSPETPLFHKGAVLYGIDLAKGAIRKEDCVLIVEGYMDVLSCHQAGVNYVVAPMGTALTAEQVKKLLRYTYQFILAFDGDGAGQRATENSLDLIEQYGGQAKVLQFPDDLDPDSFVQTYGGTKLEEFVGEAVDSLDYRLKRAMANCRIDEFGGKMKALDNIIPYLRSIKQASRLEYAIQKLSEELNLSRQAILAEIQHGRRQQGVNRALTHGEKSSPAISPKKKGMDFKRESLLLYLLFLKQDRLKAIEEVGGKKLFYSDCQKMYEFAAKQIDDYGKLTSADIPVEWSGTWAGILSSEESIEEDNQERIFAQTLSQMRLYDVNKRYNEKASQLAELENKDSFDLLDEVLNDMSLLLEEKKNIEQEMRRER